MNLPLPAQPFLPLVTAVGALLTLAAAPVQADEGMWTFDNPPRAQVKARYGVELDDAWLRRVRLGAVRIDGGCSASLVSRQGLVLTNHHCIESCLTQHSTPANDLYANGFVSGKREDELACAGMTLSVLVDLQDVTAEVQAAGFRLLRAHDLLQENYFLEFGKP